MSELHAVRIISRYISFTNKKQQKDCLFCLFLSNVKSHLGPKLPPGLSLSLVAWDGKCAFDRATEPGSTSHCERKEVGRGSTALPAAQRRATGLTLWGPPLHHHTLKGWVRLVLSILLGGTSYTSETVCSEWGLWWEMLPSKGLLQKHLYYSKNNPILSQL